MSDERFQLEMLLRVGREIYPEASTINVLHEQRGSSMVGEWGSSHTIDELPERTWRIEIVKGSSLNRLFDGASGTATKLAQKIRSSRLDNASATAMRAIEKAISDAPQFVVSIR